ncbi:MAG: hypothetical protein ABIK44_05715 [candidate division WOR-3 bacterium]
MIKTRVRNSKPGPQAWCLVALLIVTFSIALSQNSWQQLGPNGAAVSAMVNVPGYPDELYIVLEGFPAVLLHTANIGQTWTPLETIPDIINSLAIDPNHIQTIYAGGSSGRIYRSTNGGYDWQLRATVPGGISVRQLLVNPQNSTTIWAVGDAPQQESVALIAAVSTNSGQSWSTITLGKSFEARGLLLSLDPVHPNRLFAGGELGNRAKLFFSSDGGSHWSNISAGLNGCCAYGLAVNPNDSATFICATDQGLFYSSDEGRTWNQRSNLPCYSVALAPSSPNRGLAGSENLVLRSTNYGYSWTAETTQFTGTISRWLAFNPHSALEAFVANAYGVFYTSDGGYNWRCLTGTFRTLTVPLLHFPASAPETLFGTAWGYGFIKSSDRGQTWTRLKPFTGSGRPVAIAVNYRHSDTMLALTQDPRVWMTTDRGDSWVSFSLPDENFQGCGIAYHPLEPDTALTWGGFRDSTGGRLRFAIYRSTNQGQTWTRIHTRGSNGICQGLAFSPSSETIFAWGSVDGAGVVLRSIDRGRTWNDLSSGITGPNVRSLTFSPVNRNVIFCATASGVFRSDNGGLYWSNIGLENVSWVLPDTLNTNRLYAGTDTQGLFFTTDNGLYWQRDTLTISGRSILFIVRHPASRSTIFCGVAGRSLFGRNLSGIEELWAWQEQKNRLSIRPSIILRSARILIGTGSQSPVTLALFSASGRKVWESRVQVPRSGVLVWKRPSDIPPGVYLFGFRYDGGYHMTKVVFGPGH